MLQRSIISKTSLDSAWITALQGVLQFLRINKDYKDIMKLFFNTRLLEVDLKLNQEIFFYNLPQSR